MTKSPEPEVNHAKMVWSRERLIGWYDLDREFIFTQSKFPEETQYSFTSLIMIQKIQGNVPKTTYKVVQSKVPKKGLFALLQLNYM